METSTTFRTSTGTVWTVTGVLLTRVASARGEPRDAYPAVPNAVDRQGRPHVAVRVDGAVAFLAEGAVSTTGRVVEILRVASVVSAA